MALTTAPHPVIGTPQRPYRRSAVTALLGGVCAGFAVRLGVRERSVRVVFCILAFVAGAGLILYALLWLTLTRSGEEESAAQRLFRRRVNTPALVVALFATIVALFLLDPIGSSIFGVYAWPVLIALAAVGALWRGASPDERSHLSELVKSAPFLGAGAPPRRTHVWLRVVLGIAFVVGGLRILNHLHGILVGATPAIIGTFVLIAGVLILLAPWWLSTLNELTGERRARIRVEERAHVAAHLHDSVLQTLTLIERAAGDETAVVRLARTQERELRQWLFEPDRGRDATTNTLSAALRALETEIENDYGVTVELVVVGECATSDSVCALVSAAREAAINAARWSGASTLSIFAEVEPQELSIFVRDRGCGFDLDAVPADRQGIALSIRQRTTHLGGTATIRSVLGEGTEVVLTLARASS